MGRFGGTGSLIGQVAQSGSAPRRDEGSHVQILPLRPNVHSMGGMVGLMYAGAYPDKVSHLAVLDGVTVLPGSPRRPIHKRITEWVSQLDKIAERKNRYFRTLPRRPSEFRHTTSD